VLYFIAVVFALVLMEDWDVNGSCSSEDLAFYTVPALVPVIICFGFCRTKRGRCQGDGMDAALCRSDASPFQSRVALPSLPFTAFKGTKGPGNRSFG
jgi:hypothetical protein